MYAIGKGVRQNYTEALRWCRKAADKNDASAQLILGHLHNDGLGTVEDLNLAAKWYRMAADQGIPSAQYFLGKMYQDGKGMAPDYVEAYRLFHVALTGIPIAEEELRNKAAVSLREVASQMTPAQLEKARSLSVG